MTQLVKPDLSVVGRVEECLNYAGRVFGVPYGPPTAWAAWLQTAYKHKNQSFPKGVSFPVWFSGAGGDGHVAVVTPKGIYSSPYSKPVGHDVLKSIAEVERLYRVKYVGWSEDIEGKRVIKQEEVMKTNRDDSIWLWRTVKMVHSPTEAQKVAWTGKDLTKLLMDAYNDGDVTRFRDIVKNKYPAAVKTIAAQTKEIADLKKQIADGGGGYKPLGQVVYIKE